MACELCAPAEVLFETALAYMSPDAGALSKGHVMVVPKRHVESFFDMSPQEQAAVFELLHKAQKSLQALHKPDGYNIGVNVGKAAGSRACTSTCTSSRATPATCRIPPAACAACYRSDAIVLRARTRSSQALALSGRLRSR